MAHIVTPIDVGTVVDATLEYSFIGPYTTTTDLNTGAVTYSYSGGYYAVVKDTNSDGAYDDVTAFQSGGKLVASVSDVRVADFFDGLTIKAGLALFSPDDGHVIDSSFASDEVYAPDVPTLIRSYDGDDYVQGGAAADVIESGKGSDLVYGLGGDDRISGGDDGDSIDGGDGNDLLLGEAGDDILVAGGGADNLLGGGVGNDYLYGGEGIDGLDGGDGDDYLGGLAGNDHIVADDGNDTLYGDAGNDALGGGAGNDTIYGNAGNDVLDGGPHGDDYLEGGDGDDVMAGYTGNDTLNGGAGADVFIFNPETDGTDTVQGFTPGVDHIYVPDGPSIATIIASETVTPAGDGKVFLGDGQYIVFTNVTGIEESWFL